MKIKAVRVEREGGGARLVGEIERAGGVTAEVWFEYGPDYADFVREDADVFIPLCLSGSMLEGEPLETDLPVSAKMAHELHRLRDVLSVWFPATMKRIEIRIPNAVAKPPNEANAAGLFFSAGVDAYYSLMMASEGLRHEYAPLKYLIYMRGLEAPLSRAVGDKLDRVVRIGSDLGCPVITGRTNLREVFDYEYMPYVCGPALAGVGLSLSRGLSEVRIATGTSYAASEFRGGSTGFLIDRLRSTEYLYIEKDGGEARRSEKVEFLVNYPYVLENLSVCTRNLGAWDNCGVCPKCVRTMISLQALGALEKCPSLPSPFDYRLIRTVQLKGFVEKYMLRANLALAERTGRDPKLVKKLRRHIWRHEKYRALADLVANTPLHPPARWLRQFVKDHFGPGRRT